MRIMLRGTVAATLILSVSSLSAQQFGQAQRSQPQPFGQQGREQSGPKFEVVAMVNGDAITKPELDARVRRQLKDKRVGPETAEKVRKQTLGSLIESRLIEQHVAEKGPDVEDQEVASVVERIKQQLASQEVGFDEFLVSRGYTEKAFKKRIEGSLSWQKYQQQQLTPQNLQRYFQLNKDQFQGDSFQESQQQVVEAYTASLWDKIVRQMKPKAEIKLMENPAGSATPQRQPPPRGLPR